jgi:hypothetical protein
LCKFSGFSTAGFLGGLALSWFILFGLGLFVAFGDFASDVQGQFCQGERLCRLEARRGDGGLEDEGSGFETHRGGSFGIVEQIAESFEGAVGYPVKTGTGFNIFGNPPKLRTLSIIPPSSALRTSVSFSLFRPTTSPWSPPSHRQAAPFKS